MDAERLKLKRSLMACGLTFKFSIAFTKKNLNSMLSGIAISSVIALVAYTSQVNAHGVVDQPKPTWKDGPNVGWVTAIDNYWDIGTGGDQVGKYKTLAKEKGMSVKDVALDMVKDKKCGNTLENGTPQPIPSDGNVVWLGNGGDGFSHQGPCEIYIDDKMVLHGDNCEEEFPGGPLKSGKGSAMPVDFSSCNGKCLLTFYWVAFQNANWQAYVNCIPLSGSGGAAAQTQGSADAPTKQGSMDEDKGKSSPEEQKKDQEQQQNQAPSPQPGQQDQEKKEKGQKEVDEQKKKDEGQQNQPPSPQQDQQKQQEEDKKKKEEEQKKQQNQQQNQPPSPQQNQQDQQKQQEDQKKQEEEQKKQQGQQQNQPPSPQQDQQKQQEDQKKQQEEQQKQQDQQQSQQQQQSDQPPSTEQRSMDFTNLKGGTGTVQPARNLRK